MDKSHIHTPEDGRGPRYVYVDGRLIRYAEYADTKRGLVVAAMEPIRVDKWKKRILKRRVRGHVEVVERREDEA